MDSYWNDRTVLVTGASGFIGSCMVEHLANAGARVTAQVSHNSDRTFPKGVKVAQADLTDFSVCQPLIKGNSVLFNFAALDGGAEFKAKYPALIFRTNTQIVSNILEAARLSGTEKVLLMSSTEVYPKNATGVLTEDMVMSEGTGEGLTDGYIASKRFTEAAASIYSRQYKVIPIIIRMGNVYGPGDKTDRGRVIPMFIEHALNNQTISIWGETVITKSFLYVLDAVKILSTIMEKVITPTCVNVAGEQPVTLEQLAMDIVRIAGGTGTVQSAQSKVPDSERSISTKRMRDFIQDMKEVPLHEGLTRTISYYRKGRKV